MAERMSRKPQPPASTTPASLSLGSKSGVFCNAPSAAVSTAAKNASRSDSGSSFATCLAQSAAARMTVRMVPSVGFITAP